MQMPFDAGGTCDGSSAKTRSHVVDRPGDAGGFRVAPFPMIVRSSLVIDRFSRYTPLVTMMVSPGEAALIAA